MGSIISLIIPVFNEEKAIVPFMRAVLPVIDKQPEQFELLFIDDGSVDGTAFCLSELSAKDSRIRVIELSRNFGKESALSAGIDHACGDALIPMDVDLQDPPDLIATFIMRWQEGYDIVYGVRASRNDDSYAKRQSASWFYRIFNKVSPLQIPDNAGDYRLIDRQVADVIRMLPERNRFMKGLFSWVGFKSIGVPYQRPARVAGSTKWNHWRLWNFALDGLLSFSTIPLRLWTYFGAFVALISFIYGCFIVVRTIFTGVDLPGYASLFSAVVFLSGIQLISIGIIGEYLARIFIEVKQRPIYVVRKEHGR